MATALLYLVFLVICVFGLRAWQQSLGEVALPAGAT